MDTAAAVALFVLTLQNISVPIMMRLARTTSGGGNMGNAYCIPVLVCFQEVFKIVFSIGLLVREQGGLNQAIGMINQEILLKPKTTLKLGVPALCYFIQNNCQQLANSYLPAAVYAVTYQGKTLVVALMSVLMLNKKLQMFRWVAIAGLAVGVAMVQCAKAPDNASKEYAGSEFLVGLTYAVTAASMSGFAGVYFEKMIKKSQPGTKSQQPSLWIRNIQLAIFTLFIGVPTVYTSASFDAADPLRGFDGVVWGLGLNNAVGGLLVALVVKSGHKTKIMPLCS
uniref:Uncharacterized protein n=1 Tax=Lotharella globosa TaxID=91324 RepID=A0A7S4DXS0_9EUKA